MGLLSIIIGVVAVVGAVFTGGGTLALLAAGLTLGAAMAQQGWLGGGMKNFFNSSIGKDLTMAASVASIGSSLANVATSASSAATTADTAATSASGASGGIDAATGIPNDIEAPAASAASVANTGAAATGAANAAAQTPSQFLNSVLDPTNSVGSFAGSAANDAEMAPGAASAQATLQANSAAAGANTTAATTEGQTQAAAGAAGQGSGVQTEEVNNAPATQVKGWQGDGSTGQNQAGMGDDIAANDAARVTAPGSPTLQDPTEGLNPSAPNMPPTQSALSAGASAAGSFLKNNPSAMLMGGQALSGLAQGAMQNKTMQEQIAAEQWASKQWANPALAAQFETANEAPINVPGGYLQRAAQVRSMVSGSQSGQPQPGSQPSAAPTSAPAAAVAPVGMGPTPNGGNVPILGMSATPRGGVV
jgi:hypothetical protein